ncbi:MAG: serine/threonine protein kinase [Syntrophobacteraceae bacterium]
MIIPNYQILEKLAETEQSIVLKAYNKKHPDRLLVLKVLKTVAATDRKLAQLTQRIEHLRVLNDPLIITPIRLSAQDDCFITQEYFDGVSLDKLKEAGSRFPLGDFFTISCKIAQALHRVHEAGILHGGIKPHNILVNPDTLDIRLIDFISSLDVREVSHFIYDPNFVKGTLSYTSPEQTGRINHRVVFSSDLYSLGVIFYEMLTGRLPFFSNDPLQLIHYHLAEEAPGVADLNPDIPSRSGQNSCQIAAEDVRKAIRERPGTPRRSGTMPRRIFLHGGDTRFCPGKPHLFPED